MTGPGHRVSPPVARLGELRRLRVNFRLALAMAPPATAVTTIFTLVFSWNEFVFAVFLTRDKVQTMPVALRKTIDVHNVSWGSPSAGGVIRLLPMVFLVFVVQRPIARGLAPGTVKQSLVGEGLGHMTKKPLESWIPVPAGSRRNRLRRCRVRRAVS